MYVCQSERSGMTNKSVTIVRWDHDQPYLVPSCAINENGTLNPDFRFSGGKHTVFASIENEDTSQPSEKTTTDGV